MASWVVSRVESSVLSRSCPGEWAWQWAPASSRDCARKIAKLGTEVCGVQGRRSDLLRHLFLVCGADPVPSVENLCLAGD